MNKKSSMYKFLSCMHGDIKELPMRLFSYVCCIFPINKRKIIINNPNFRETRTFTENILKDPNDYELVWAVKDDHTSHESIRIVKRDTFRYAYELMTSSVWVDNSRIDHWAHKRKKQLYFQTWHGAIAMKKIEKDAEDVLSAFYIAKAKHDSKLIDYFVAETAFIEKLLKDTFWYEGKVLRGEFKDNLLKQVDREKVYNQLGIDKDVNVALYVPTFRSNNNTDCYDMKYDEVINKFEKKFGDKWIFIIRLHPNIASKSEDIEFNEKVINGTYYPDLGELIQISNVLITDYSSCMFYGYRANKKVFIYASDYYEYMLNDRGGYFKYEDLPASLSKSTDELLDNIENYQHDIYMKKVRDFNDNIGYYEDDVMDYIIKIIHNHIL